MTIFSAAIAIGISGTLGGGYAFNKFETNDASRGFSSVDFADDMVVKRGVEILALQIELSAIEKVETSQLKMKAVSYETILENRLSSRKRIIRGEIDLDKDGRVDESERRTLISRILAALGTFGLDRHIGSEHFQDILGILRDRLKSKILKYHLKNHCPHKASDRSGNLLLG